MVITPATGNLNVQVFRSINTPMKKNDARACGNGARKNIREQIIRPGKEGKEHCRVLRYRCPEHTQAPSGGNTREEERKPSYPGTRDYREGTKENYRTVHRVLSEGIKKGCEDCSAFFGTCSCIRRNEGPPHKKVVPATVRILIRVIFAAARRKTCLLKRKLI